MQELGKMRAHSPHPESSLSVEIHTSGINDDVVLIVKIIDGNSAIAHVTKPIPMFELLELWGNFGRYSRNPFVLKTICGKKMFISKSGNDIGVVVGDSEGVYETVETVVGVAETFSAHMDSLLRKYSPPALTSPYVPIEEVNAFLLTGLREVNDTAFELLTEGDKSSGYIVSGPWLRANNAERDVMIIVNTDGTLKAMDVQEFAGKYAAA